MALLSALFGTAFGLRAINGSLYDEQGQIVKFKGVNKMGGEYVCLNGGVFDGPTDDASLNAMASWKVNALRMGMNEDCWLNINGIKTGGDSYINPIVEYVERVTKRGWYVILELHWAAAGSTKATGQTPMANTDHSITFWKGVAARFKNNSKVIFDVYNEPYGISWACWRDGCQDHGYQIAGMQQLVDAVRGTGATNLIMLGGLSYANDLSQWLAHVPKDPHNNLAASFHSYNFNACKDENCWNSQVAPILSHYPVVTGEVGENDCAHGYIDKLLPWLDSKGINYLAWTWNPYDCSKTPALISDYKGTPTNYGAGYKAHL